MTGRQVIVPAWLREGRYQTVLRATKTVAFEFNPKTGAQYVSPFIHEFLAGNYDGRLLSQVMLEDGVIYPDDVEMSLRFREKAAEGRAHEMTLRLKTPSGAYRWFRFCLCPHHEGDEVVHVGTITDVDDEIRQREALRYQAEYDMTTGIFNKQTFYRATEDWFKADPAQMRCLIRLDIDRFKVVNELYSVARGDEVLRFAGSALKKLLHLPETYARINNDVFCLCVERAEHDAAELVEQFEQELNRYPLDFPLIVSAGILPLPRYNGQTIDILCDRAAMAQRTVKGSYMHRYAFYEESMSRALSREHYITSCMRQALEGGQFQIYLQPKYDMLSKTIVGAEALVRWKHPVDGMIPPGDFIPLFERNGFILSLDEYIWELTCKTLRRWLDAGREPVPVSVNVSRVHLREPSFCDKLRGLLEKYRLPPRYLELEITESAYTENPQTLYGIMDKLQETGFSFSMDDFGSGYSSLNALKDIPVNVVKIDLNFLREARRGEKAGRGILRGAVQLVRGIDLPIIAEGVETAEQAEFLMSVGCTCAQGYYYARPMPVPEFETLLWH